MSIDQHIEELRSEFNACLDAQELVQIEAELQAALADLERLEHRGIGMIEPLD